MLCCFMCVYIYFKSLGARNKTEEKLLEILQAKELPNFHETLSCLQEHLTAKAVKMASRLYLMPGEKLMAFGLIRLNLTLLEDYFELEVQKFVLTYVILLRLLVLFVDFVVAFVFEKVLG